MGQRLWIDLVWGESSAPIEYCEPSDFMYETTGDIVEVVEDDDRAVIEKFNLYYVDVDAACNEGVSAFDVFDSYSHTVGYYGVIFDHKSGFVSDKLCTALRDDLIIDRNVLILDRLEILPEFRGQGIGLLAMRKMIQRFCAGAGVVAIKPFPLQDEYKPIDEGEWRTKHELGKFERHSRRATVALKRYYGKLGFVPLKDTPYMFRSTAAELPTNDELVVQAKSCNKPVKTRRTRTFC